MTIYEDYEHWKSTNKELLEVLVSDIFNALSRWKHIFLVLEHLLSLQKQEAISPEEEEIFQTGFHYLFDRLTTVNFLLEKVFHHDIEEMEAFSNTIHLLSYIMDFADEISSVKPDDEKNYQKFIDLENTVLAYLEEHQPIPKELFDELDTIASEAFQGEYEFYSVPDIFFDIALDYDLAEEEDEDEFSFLPNVDTKLVS